MKKVILGIVGVVGLAVVGVLGMASMQDGHTHIERSVVVDATPPEQAVSITAIQNDDLALLTARLSLY